MPKGLPVGVGMPKAHVRSLHRAHLPLPRPDQEKREQTLSAETPALAYPPTNGRAPETGCHVLR
jgi:hypothetical protein